MQEENSLKYSNFPEVLLEKFEESLKSELNIHDNLSDEQFEQILISIIKEYENEFYDEFNDIFIYTYYSNLVYNKTIDKILEFVKTRESMNNKGKPEVLKSERTACQDVL